MPTVRRALIALAAVGLLAACSHSPAGPTYGSPRAMLAKIQSSDPGLLRQCHWVGYNIWGALSESCFGPNGDTIYLDTFAKQSIGEQECQATTVLCHLGNGWSVTSANSRTMHELVTYLNRSLA